MNIDRFKFRVWDNIAKKYDTMKTLYLEQEGGVCFPDIDYIGGMTFPPEGSDFIIETCTGLRDKKGKLIYEGDVIENTFRDGTKAQWFIVWNEEEMQHVKLNIPYFKQEKLEFVKNFSMAKYIVYYSCGIKKETAFLYEIIGNIHDPKFGIELGEGDSK